MFEQHLLRSKSIMIFSSRQHWFMAEPSRMILRMHKRLWPRSSRPTRLRDGLLAFLGKEPPHHPGLCRITNSFFLIQAWLAQFGFLIVERPNFQCSKRRRWPNDSEQTDLRTGSSLSSGSLCCLGRDDRSDWACHWLEAPSSWNLKMRTVWKWNLWRKSSSDSFWFMDSISGQKRGVVLEVLQDFLRILGHQTLRCWEMQCILYTDVCRGFLDDVPMFQEIKNLNSDRLEDHWTVEKTGASEGLHSCSTRMMSEPYMANVLLLGISSQCLPAF